ncbi:MBOAT family O-acyltransferase [Budvicia diplopodorum]|uniref:MBOAT family O-acyltransferase n=1 Tax=Budvicia diplopodorum TaxID=1119056 RepID=UPI0013575D73|nr:MBOAT family O-acyltransferase [Budvicia diplopodorum]
MSFFSLDFSYYFVIFFLLYWLLRPYVAVQNYLLIAASYLFVYSFSIGSAVILFGYSIFIYLLGRLSTSNRLSGKKPVYILLTALVVSCFTLFKYYPFFREGLQAKLAQIGLTVEMPVLDILVPLGLSFYAFHSVSYVVSVCKEEIKPASFPDLILYLCFLPSIVAGPINRASVFLPQIHPQQPRELLNVNRAIALIAWAIAKLFLCSAFLAENLVNGVFESPDNAEPLQILIAVYAYAWQIYFNFSGYTNLVTGLALLLGFQVPKNFNSPYLSHNLQEFWKRWHISLSEFIRDYIYIPLGGNKNGFMRKNANLMAAMVISGIWHGVGLNFIVWGALHGLGLVLFNIKHKYRPASASGHIVSNLAAQLLTFHYVCFAWIFFRASDFGSAGVILHRLSEISLSSLFLDCNAVLVWLFVLLVSIYPLWTKIKASLVNMVERLPWYAYPAPLIAFLTLVFIFAPAGVPGFIYANF